MAGTKTSFCIVFIIEFVKILLEVEENFEKHLKYSAETSREDLDLKFQSLKTKLEQIKEKYVNEVDSIETQIKS